MCKDPIKKMLAQRRKMLDARSKANRKAAVFRPAVVATRPSVAIVPLFVPTRPQVATRPSVAIVPLFVPTRPVTVRTPDEIAARKADRDAAQEARRVAYNQAEHARNVIANRIRNSWGHQSGPPSVNECCKGAASGMCSACRCD